jgi:hypothetical protein
MYVKLRLLGRFTRTVMVYFHICEYKILASTYFLDCAILTIWPTFPNHLPLKPWFILLPFWSENLKTDLKQFSVRIWSASGSVGSVIYLDGSGSGSFHQQTKKWRKPWFLLFYDFFVTIYPWRMMWMYWFFQKGISIKKCFFVGVLKVTDENSRIRNRSFLSQVRIRVSGFACRSVPKYHGSRALKNWPDSLFNATGPEPRLLLYCRKCCRSTETRTQRQQWRHCRPRSTGTRPGTSSGLSSL